ncbi:MAG: DUF3168 domain-containing protein [Planctomycetota bacterium]
MILHAIRSMLIADTFVGGSTTGWGASIYTAQAPQDQAAPYVVLHLISSSEGHSHDGPNGFVRGRVQADAYGGTVEQAHALARAVHNALDGFKGKHAETTLDIAYIEQDRTYDLPTPTPRGAELPDVFGVATDFRFAHQQQPVTTPVPA